MEQRRLGATGVDVTRVILGCGNFGGVGSAPAFFGQGESEEEAFAIMDAAWNLGVRVFDTADAYGGGRSEAWIGRWLASRGHSPVLATKVFNSVVGDAQDRGLAPDRIRRQIEGSLERLGVERVDLYLIHAPDPDTPLEETLGAFDELVRAGKVGAIGASNVDRGYLQEALAISEREGYPRFEWVQNSYSLLDREPEEGVLQFCAEQGLGFTPFSPLAGGWLTGKYARGESYPAGSRMTQRPEPYTGFDSEHVWRGLDRLRAAAEERGVDMSTLAFAWLLSNPAVTAVVVGPRRPEHLEPARRALQLDLSQQERDELAAYFADGLE
jgi:aryl-alcohol dehydrogenase-like predicted oxidoreductase